MKIIQGLSQSFDTNSSGLELCLRLRSLKYITEMNSLFMGALHDCFFGVPLLSEFYIHSL